MLKALIESDASSSCFWLTMLLLEAGQASGLFFSLFSFPYTLHKSLPKKEKEKTAKCMSLYTISGGAAVENLDLWNIEVDNKRM